MRPCRTKKGKNAAEWRKRRRGQEGKAQNGSKPTHSIFSGMSFWVMHTQLTTIVTVINVLNHLRGCVKEKLRVTMFPWWHL